MKNTIIKISILTGTIAINLSAQDFEDYQEKYDRENSIECLNPTIEPEYPLTLGTTIGYSSIKSEVDELDENYIPFHGTPSHKNIESYIQNIDKEEEREKQERLQSEQIDKLQSCLELLYLINPYIKSSIYIRELLKKYTKV